MSGRWLAQRVALVVGRGAHVDAIADALRAHGAQISRADFVSDQAAAEAALAEAGAVSILVHAGPEADHVRADAMALAAWREVLNRGLDSRFFHASTLARAAIAARRAAAILFLETPAVGAAQAAALGASGNLTKTLAVEWARDGVRTNTIRAAPGADAAALGNLAAYLASDYAAYITGATVGVD